MSQQIGVAGGACSGSLRSRGIVLVCRITQIAARREQTISAPGYVAGIELPRELCFAELAQEVRIAGSKRSCGIRTSILAHILHLGKIRGTSCNVVEITECCDERYSRQRQINHFRLDFLCANLQQPTVGWFGLAFAGEIGWLYG